MKGKKDHFLCRSRSETVKQDTTLNLSIIASVRFSNKRMLQDWNWRTPITDMLNLDENKFACNKNFL